MTKNNDKLTCGLRQAKDSICRKLCSKSLLSYDVRQDCIDGKSGIDSTISALQDRIKNDSKAYYEFLEVLSDDPALKYLVNILEEDRKALEEQARQPKDICKSVVITQPDSISEENSPQRKYPDSTIASEKVGSSAPIGQFKGNSSFVSEEKLSLPCKVYPQVL